MTKTNAFSLLCMVIRAIALWSALQMAISLPMLLLAFKDQSAFFTPVQLCILFAVLFAIVVLFWFFADKIARLALTRPSDHVFESDIDPSIWFGLVLAGIGAWHLFDALLHGFTLWAQTRVVAGVGAADVLASLKWQIAGNVLEAAISVALILGGRGLAAALHRLRYAGTQGSQDG